MMNFKRLITITLSFILLLASFQLTGVADANSAVITDEVATVLTYLEIVDTAIDDSTLKNPVSRADFALYTGKLIGIDEGDKCDKRFYTDLPADHWAANTINTMTDMGIISGSEGKFNPDITISEPEALSMLLNAMGFKPVAQIKGGYPAGYRALARECEITAGRVEAAELTFADACELLYNTLFSPIPEMYTISSDGNNGLYINKDMTVLEDNFNMVRVSGVLTSALGVSVDAETACDDDKVRIGGITYYNDCDDAIEYLGREVNAYYLKDGNDKRVTMIFPTGVDDCIEIDIKDFVGYDEAAHEISYVINDRIRTQTIDVSATIVRNGEGFSSKIKEAFEGLKKGKIVLSKSGNSTYDIVMIKNYEDVVVLTTDASSQKIYDKIAQGNIIDLHKVDNIRVFDSESNKKTFTDIAVNSVLSICRSDNYCEILISNKTVSGIVTEIKSNSTETIVRIENEYYPVDKDYYAANAYAFDSGERITAYINVFGECVFVGAGVPDVYLVGYVIGVASDFFEGSIIKLLNQSGAIETLYCAENIIIDGVKKSTESEIEAALSARNSGMANRQVIRYMLNSDNKIRKIETAVPYGQTAQDLNSLRAETKLETFKYYSGNAMLGPSIKLASDTICFVVPTASATDVEDKDYTVVAPSELASNSTYTAVAYKTSDATNTADIVLIETDESSIGEWYHYLVFVESVYDMYDEEEQETIKVADVWVNGTKSTYYAADGRSFDTMPTRDGSAINSIQAGDVLRVYKNPQGKITSADIAYSYSTKTPSTLGTDWDTYELFINCGYITSIKEGVIKFERIENGEKVTGITGSAPIVVFDPNMNNDKVTIGGDIDLYEAMNDKSLIYVGQRYGTTNMIVILK